MYVLRNPAEGSLTVLVDDSGALAAVARARRAARSAQIATGLRPGVDVVLDESSGVRTATWVEAGSACR